MSMETVNRMVIANDIVTVTLKVDKTHLSSGDILTAQASFSQLGKSGGLFVTSECFIATPVGGPLGILDTREKCVASKDDAKLSAECQKTYRHLPILMGNAMIQASGVFISRRKERHHVITNPLIVKVEKSAHQKHNQASE